MFFSARRQRIADPIRPLPAHRRKCVGQGGMAVVYKATRHGPNGFAKTLVVKAMLPALTSATRVRLHVLQRGAPDGAARPSQHRPGARLRRRRRDSLPGDGVPAPGRNLSQLRAAVSLGAAGSAYSVGCAIAIAREMCHGLGYAHDFVDSDGKRRQIVHRDVSPSNVMIMPRRLGEAARLRRRLKIIGEFDYDVTQSFKGKYAYMAPGAGEPSADRSAHPDVFAAGIVLHLSQGALAQAPSPLQTRSSRRCSGCRRRRSSPRRWTTATCRARSTPSSKKRWRAIPASATCPAPQTGRGARHAPDVHGLAAPLARLALVAELFANDRMVVCDVCGNQVMPGLECGECGTAAPASHRAWPSRRQVALDPEARGGAGLSSPATPSEQLLGAPGNAMRSLFEPLPTPAPHRYALKKSRAALGRAHDGAAAAGQATTRLPAATSGEIEMARVDLPPRRRRSSRPGREQEAEQGEPGAAGAGAYAAAADLDLDVPDPGRQEDGVVRAFAHRREPDAAPCPASPTRLRQSATDHARRDSTVDAAGADRASASWRLVCDAADGRCSRRASSWCRRRRSVSRCCR